MTVALARRLVWEGVVAAEDVTRALQVHVTRRGAFLQALVQGHPDLLERLEVELGAPRGGAVPVIVPDAALMSALPPGLLLALLAVPVGRDPTTSAVRVVAADASDPHVASELGHHLGAVVEVVAAPLRQVLAALAPRPASPDPRQLTPALGTKLQGTSPTSIRTTTIKPIVPKAQPSRQSEPPIPLVRLSADPVHAPNTVKGVAPQATGPGYAPQVVVSPRATGALTAEPLIELTRTRSLGPAAQEPPPTESSGPATMLGMKALTGSNASAPGDVASDDPEDSGSGAPSLDRAIWSLEKAATPEDVVSALVHGLSGVASHVLVLALRGKVFEGRDASDLRARDAVRALVISSDRPSVLLTAVQTGHYVGPMPQTLVHAESARILGDTTDEIAVGVVTVSGRAALVYVVSGLETAYLATRRGDRLVQEAGRALDRIVRDRKK